MDYNIKNRKISGLLIKRYFSGRGKKRKNKILKNTLKRCRSLRKGKNDIDFLKIKTYNNQDRIRMQKSISLFKIRKRGN